MRWYPFQQDFFFFRECRLRVEFIYIGNYFIYVCALQTDIFMCARYKTDTFLKCVERIPNVQCCDIWSIGLKRHRHVESIHCKTYTPSLILQSGLYQMWIHHGNAISRLIFQILLAYNNPFTI